MAGCSQRWGIWNGLSGGQEGQRREGEAPRRGPSWQENVGRSPPPSDDRQPLGPSPVHGGAYIRPPLRCPPTAGVPERHGLSQGHAWHICRGHLSAYVRVGSWGRQPVDNLPCTPVQEGQQGGGCGTDNWSGTRLLGTFTVGLLGVGGAGPWGGTRVHHLSPECGVYAGRRCRDLKKQQQARGLHSWEHGLS